MTDEQQAVIEQPQLEEKPVEAEKSEETEQAKKQYDPDVIPKKHVTDIVRRERLEAYHKGRKEAMAEFEAQQVANNQQPAAQQPAQTGLGGMQSMSPDQIQQMIAQAVGQAEEKRQKEMQQKQYEQAAYHIAQKFKSSMESGKAKYSDFDEKVKDMDFGGMSPLIALATETGIPEDIVYDLADNPQKITHLMILAHTQPALAKREMDKLAASIKTNQAAQQQASPRAPLSQIQPSTVGTDSGQMSVTDYRKMFSSGASY